MPGLADTSAFGSRADLWIAQRSPDAQCGPQKKEPAEAGAVPNVRIRRGRRENGTVAQSCHAALVVAPVLWHGPRADRWVDFPLARRPGPNLM